MAKNRKLKLGKGLGELLGEIDDSYSKDIKGYQKNTIDINIIDTSPYQPRKTFDEKSIKELSQSIKEHGILQPIIVQKNNERYTLIAGERRLRAGKMANLEEISCVIIDTKEQNIRKLAIIENIQREELLAIELAYAYRLLISEHEITHEELAKTLGKSRAHITNTLRLLNLNDEIQEQISSKQISSGHGKIIAGLDKEEQKEISKKIIDNKISVRETESIVKKMKSKVLVKSNNDNEYNHLDKNKITAITGILRHLKVKSVAKNDKLLISLDNNEDINILYSLLSRIKGASK